MGVVLSLVLMLALVLLMMLVLHVIYWMCCVHRVSCFAVCCKLPWHVLCQEHHSLKPRRKPSVALLTLDTHHSARPEMYQERFGSNTNTPTYESYGLYFSGHSRGIVTVVCLVLGVLC